MKRWLGALNANTVIAVAALFTSVTAVVVAWDESRLVRRSQEASFMPLMEVRSTLSTAEGDLRVTLALRNTGHGVAFVETSSFEHDGEAIESYGGFMRRVLTEELGQTADFSFAGSRGYYEPGEEREVLIFRWDDTPENREALGTFLRTDAVEKAEAMSVTLCYCSVFGACYVREGSDAATRPREVASCSPDGTSDPVEALWRTYNERDQEDGDDDS